MLVTLALVALQSSRPILLDPPLLAPAGLVRGVRVHALVRPPAVEVRLELDLRNDGDEERAYELVLPLGRDAAVSALGATVDGRELAGGVLAVEEACALLGRLAAENQDPTWLAHYGQAAYRANVPIPAHAGVTVALRYARAVERENDLWRVALPLTAVRNGGIAAPVAVTGEVATREPLSTLYSPTHDLEERERWVSWEGSAQTLHTSFAYEEAASALDTDLVFYVKTTAAGEVLDVAVISERPDPSEDGVFLAVVGGVPGAALEPEPKDVVFVLDRSGSMKGEKIEQAKAALLYLAERLRPEDRFDLVDYSTVAASFAGGLTSPDRRTLDALAEHVAAIAAEGGTNIEAALTTALSSFVENDSLKQIVFLTDGLPTEGVVEETALAKLVREHNEHAVRLVAFGVGFDVNGSLLDRLASENRGVSEYVLPDQDVALRIPGFYERVRAPLVLDTEVALEGVEANDVLPRLAGDVYAGHRLVLTGRYSKAGAAKLVVRGVRGGKRIEMAFPFELAAQTERADGAGLVARIWAAKKVGALVDELRLAGEPDPEKAKAIVELGTRYGVLTEYTAFLAAPETDLAAHVANVERCQSELTGRTAVVSGTHGVAQACNTKALQRSDQVTCNSWLGADGNRVTLGGVQCVAGNTFFKRGDAWVDSRGVLEADREVELYSDEFYALLDRHPWVGACVAKTGEVVLDVGGERVRIKRPC